MDTVKDWMSSPAIIAEPATTLPEARRLLADKRIRRLPIAGPNGQLLGIVTEGDINRVSDSPAHDVREYNLYHRAADLPLADIMTRAVVTVGPDTPLSVAARLLLDHRIGGMPVVENGRIIGIISESDLFRRIVVQEAELLDRSAEPGAVLE
jgi:CBS domain-containing protein